MSWKTKPSDRFVLRFIKIHLAAPLSSALVRISPRIRPAALTLAASLVGIGAGFSFGLGLAWLGGLLAAAAQVMDAMDGQVARLTGSESAEGAFLDSVLDRYMDFSLLFGMLLHGLRFSSGLDLGGIVLEPWILVLLAGLAAAGTSQVSFTTARAAALNLDFRRPELAGRGTRTAVIVACGLLTPLWIHFPVAGLAYLALHPNAAVIGSLFRLRKGDAA